MNDRRYELEDRTGIPRMLVWTVVALIVIGLIVSLPISTMLGLDPVRYFSWLPGYMLKFLLGTIVNLVLLFLTRSGFRSESRRIGALKIIFGVCGIGIVAALTVGWILL